MRDTGKLQLRLFGRFAVTTGDNKPVKISGKKNQALLTYLAANADRPQPRERLAGLLWGDRFDDQARQSLRQAISKLRNDLGDAGEKLLLIDGDDIAMNSVAISVDALKFEKLAANETSEALEEAATLYGGAFLDGFSIKESGFEDWISAQRTRYADLAAEVLSKCCLQQEAIGQINEAIATGKKLVLLDPLREQAHRRLMRLLANNGQRSQGLKQYKLCSDILQKELGVEPDVRTKQLYEEIRGSEVSVPATPQEIGQPDAGAQASPSVPDKPSIAVLPFDNLSNDIEQDFLADGMTEDVIAGLSKFSWLFVIARRSTSVYKGQSRDVREIALELGVRYVLEGSIRRAGNRVRVTAALIDAETGNDIWSERFDRRLEDIFAVQDEVAGSIILAIAPEIGHAEIARSRRKPPESLDAWGLYQRGLSLYPSGAKEDFEAAIELFDRAREADPNFVDALAMAAHMRLRYIFFFRPENTDALLEEARGLLQTAMRLDQRNATCHCAMGRLHYMLGEHESAVSMCREAIALNPNSVLSHFEMAVAFGGLRRWKEMLEHFDMARRLSPRDPHTAAAYAGRAVSLFQLGRYQECVDSALTASLSPNPRYWADVVLVAALTVLGRTAEAESAKKVLLARKPDFTLAGMNYLKALNTQRVHDALRKAGLPE